MASDQEALPQYHSTVPVNINNPCVIIAPVQINIQNIHYPPTSLVEETAPKFSQGLCTDPTALIRLSRERKITCSIFNTTIAVLALIATIALGILQITNSNPTGTKEYPNSSGNGTEHYWQSASRRFLFSSKSLPIVDDERSHARDTRTPGWTGSTRTIKHESIRRQADSAIMFGGMESYETWSAAEQDTKPKIVRRPTTAPAGITYEICHVPTETSQSTLSTGASNTIARETQPTEAVDVKPSIETTKGPPQHDEL